MFQFAAPYLSALGKRFGIDAHYFAKHMTVVTASHCVTVLHGIVVSYLITRFFAPELYGSYRFVLTIISTIGLLKLGGLPSAIAVSLSKDKNPPLRTTLRYYILCASLGSLALFGSIPLLPLWGREELWPLFFIAGVLFLPEAIGTTFFGGIVKGKALFPLAFRTSLVIRCTVTVLAGLILFFRPSPALLLLCTLGVPGVVYCTQALRLIGRPEEENESSHVFSYGLKLSLATIPISLAWHLDALLISAFFGMKELALFSVALLIPEQAKVWFKELLPISFSKQAAGDDSPERRRKLEKAVVLMCGVFALGIAAYACIIPFAVPLLFPQYDAGRVTLLTIAAAVTLITTPTALFHQFLEARKLLKPLRTAQWTSAALFALSLLWLIPNMGLLGAIIARGIFRFSYAALSWYFVRSHPITH